MGVNSPSEAVDAGLCPACLGRKVVFKIVEGREGPCSSCDGTGTLDGLERVAERLSGVTAEELREDQ